MSEFLFTMWATNDPARGHQPIPPNECNMGPLLEWTEHLIEWHPSPLAFYTVSVPAKCSSQKLYSRAECSEKVIADNGGPFLPPNNPEVCYVIHSHNRPTVSCTVIRFETFECMYQTCSGRQ